MDEVAPGFLAFLRQGLDRGGFGTDDVLAALLPLFEQIQTQHELDQVAPLNGLSAIDLVDD